MILADTSGLLAYYDRTDTEHDRCVRALTSETGLVVSPFVLAELDYLVLSSLGRRVEIEVLADVAGSFEIASFGSPDVLAAIDVIRRYRAFDLGIADASVVILAERYDCLKLLTLDERHFRAMTVSGAPFRILPADP